MKTKNFWLVLVLGTIITALSSCQKDDDPIIIDSEVLESGLSSDIKANSTEKGTTLSYESWIMVRQSTRAVSDNRVSVTIHNILSNTGLETTVQSYETGIPEISIERKFMDSKQDGFVTVVDSVLVYSLAYGLFTVDCELIFQVPFFNDGITKQSMPYHPITKIVNQGHTLTDAGFVTDEKGYVYSRKEYKQKLRVTCGGVEYDVTPTVMLRRCVSNGGPYIKATEVLDKGLRINQNGNYESWATFKQKWSTEEVKTVTYSAEIMPNIQGKIHSPILVSNDHFQIISRNIKDIKSESVRDVNEYIRIMRYQREYSAEFNHFTTVFELNQEEPVYDDGAIVYSMPSITVEDLVDEFGIEGGVEEIFEGTPSLRYDFHHKLSAKIGELSCEGRSDFPVFVRK